MLCLSDFELSCRWVPLNIGNITKFLDQASAETLVHSFVTSKIDYCNALLFGLPKYQLNRLQLVSLLLANMTI